MAWGGYKIELQLHSSTSVTTISLLSEIHASTCLHSVYKQYGGERCVPMHDWIMYWQIFVKSRYRLLNECNGADGPINAILFSKNSQFVIGGGKYYDLFCVPFVYDSWFPRWRWKSTGIGGCDFQARTGTTTPSWEVEPDNMSSMG